MYPTTYQQVGTASSDNDQSAAQGAVTHGKSTQRFDLIVNQIANKFNMDKEIVLKLVEEISRELPYNSSLRKIRKKTTSLIKDIKYVEKYKQRIIADILKILPNTMCIVQKNKNNYLAIVPYENFVPLVDVIQITWNKKRTTIYHTEKETNIPKKLSANKIIWHNEKWPEWNSSTTDVNLVIAPSEIDFIIGKLLSTTKHKLAEETTRTPLAILIHPKKTEIILVCYYHQITNNIPKRIPRMEAISYRKDYTVIETRSKKHGTISYKDLLLKLENNWEILREYKENIEQLNEELNKYHRLKHIKHQLDQKVSQIVYRYFFPAWITAWIENNKKHSQQKKTRWNEEEAKQEAMSLFDFSLFSNLVQTCIKQNTLIQGTIYDLSIITDTKKTFKSRMGKKSWDIIKRISICVPQKDCLECFRLMKQLNKKDIPKKILVY